MDARGYLAEIKAKLVSSPSVASISVVEERTLPDRGYFRARIGLSNGDFLEIAEYFVVEEEHRATRRYRYQWMDESQQVLRKRWDNVEHFPELPNFPHHIHVSDESQVEPGLPLSIIELVDLIERELGSESVPL